MRRFERFSLFRLSGLCKPPTNSSPIWLCHAICNSNNQNKTFKHKEIETTTFSCFFDHVTGCILPQLRHTAAYIDKDTPQLLGNCSWACRRSTVLWFVFFVAPAAWQPNRWFFCKCGQLYIIKSPNSACWYVSSYARSCANVYNVAKWSVAPPENWLVNPKQTWNPTVWININQFN